MSQAVQTVSMIPSRRRKPVTPAVMPIEFDWSKDSWVASFIPGSDTMIVMLHHDAAELERVVAGLVAFQERTRAVLRLRRRLPGLLLGNCR